MRGWSLLAVATLAAAGCDDTLFAVPIGEAPALYTPDWDGVQEMFQDRCVACHPAVQPFVLADLEADIRDGAGVYVVAGDPEASMFWRLISATRLPDDPQVMPQTSPTGLPLPERVHVEQWILDGAPLPDAGEDTDG